MATIFWAGDSTVQYNGIMTYPQTGIGQVFHLFLKPEVKVEHQKGMIGVMMLFGVLII